MLSYNSFNTHTILTISQIDSTNNFAHTLIDANQSKNGLFILATNQTAGKGQRSNAWYDGLPDEQMAASLIIEHTESKPENMFILNMAVSLAIVDTLKTYLPNAAIAIKWSNDILVNNKKIAGILIENIIRGSSWTHTIIGIGLNINTISFPDYLPQAISMQQCSKQIYEVETVAKKLFVELDKYLQLAIANGREILELYNSQLFLMDKPCTFIINNIPTIGICRRVTFNGFMQLEIGPDLISYAFNEVKQVWEQD